MPLGMTDSPLKKKLVHGHKEQSRGRRAVQQRGRLHRARNQRFLSDHVGAAIERLLNERAVRGEGRADVHNVHRLGALECRRRPRGGMRAREQRCARRVRVDDRAHDVPGVSNRVGVPPSHEPSADDRRPQGTATSAAVRHAVALLGAAPICTDSNARTAGVSSTSRSPVDAER